jgi:hypothetical protein
VTAGGAGGADAIMGVSVFGVQAPDDFGRFEQAFVTMFRLTTDGQWPLSIPSYEDDGGVNWRCAAFMMSYIVVVNWVVLQVRGGGGPAHPRPRCWARGGGAPPR